MNASGIANALLADRLHHRLVAFGEWHSCVELHAAAGRLPECYVWRVSVNPYAARLQFLFQKRALDFVLGGIEDLNGA